MSRLTSFACGLAVAMLVALLVPVGPAAAHNVLVDSDPAQDESVEASPEEITLTFDLPVQEGDTNQIALTGPEGEQWVDDPIEVAGNEVSVPLGELGEPGEYTIGFRVISADGHPVSEEIPFTLQNAESGTPAEAQGDEAGESGGDPAAETDEAAGEEAAGEGSGLPLWVWIAGAAGLLAAGIALALRLGRA